MPVERGIESGTPRTAESISSFHSGTVKVSKSGNTEEVGLFDLTMTKTLTFEQPDEEVAFREYCRMKSYTQGKWIIWLNFILLAIGYANFEFQGMGLWRYVYLEGAVFLGLIQAVLSQWSPAWWRQAVNKHYHQILTVTSCHLFINDLAVNSARELLQSYDRHCEEMPVYCPSVQWHIKSWFRTFLIVMINNALGMLFRDALLVNVLMCLAFVPTFFPWGDRVDSHTGEIYAMNQVDSRILIAVSTNLLVMAVTLRRCYNQEVLTRSSFRQLHCLNLCRRLKAILMRSMMPARFQRGRNPSEMEPIGGAGGAGGGGHDPDSHEAGSSYDGQSHDGRSSVEVRDSLVSTIAGLGMVSEYFPAVSVLVCSFPKEDLDVVQDPSMFVQLVASCVTQFDQIVQKRGLFKVEHIGESYVVSSPNIYYGLESKEHNSVQAHINHAKDLVLLAHHFLSVSSATTTSTGLSLRFRAAIHSGPVTGVIAGRIRRFYRLVGSTLDTAGEMSRLAPAHSVVVSNTTRELLTGTDLCFVEIANNPSNEEEVGQQCVDSTDDSPSWSKEINQDNLRKIEKEETNKLSTFLAVLPEEDVINEDNPLMSFEKEVEGIAIDFYQSSDEASDDTVRVLCNEWLNSLIISAMQTLSVYTGEFKSSKVESRFAQSYQLEMWNDVKSWLLITLVAVLMYVFTLYTSIARASPSFMELLIPAVIAAASGSALLGLFMRMHWKDTSETIPHHRGYMWIGLFIFGGTFILVMGLCDTIFAMYGSFMFIYLRPELSERLLVRLLITFPYSAVSSFIYNSKWGDIHGQPIHIVVFQPFVFTCVFAVVQKCANTIVRVKWTLDGTLERKHEELDSLLKDLIPSSNARAFMLQQQLQQLEFNMFAYNTCSIWVTQDSLHAVVMSTDIVNFAKLSTVLAPHDVAKLLHDLWCNMDSLVENIKIAKTDQTRRNSDDGEQEISDVVYERPFKMDIVGCSYVVVELLKSNPSKRSQKRAAKTMIELAARMMTIAESHEVDLDLQNLSSGDETQQVQFRMGLSMGEVIAGVIGFVQPRYHLYGKAVHEAYATGSTAQPGCVSVCSDIAMVLVGRSECLSFDLTST